MNLRKQFEEMRPYNDNEVLSVLKRLTESTEMTAVLKFMYPESKIEKVIEHLKKIETIDEFQTFFSSDAVEKLISQTADEFTSSGLDNLELGTPYLFIANHRDIVMDSAIMEWLLKKNGFKTSQITFGSNLMFSQFIVDMGKLNKMFTFYRGGSKLDIYRHAILHSAYIREVLTQKKESIWIAQRDGRTKDGRDMTQSALLKMLLIKQDNYFESIKELNIVPVVISYELEPCDHYKVYEKYTTNSSDIGYKKSEGEDFRSVVEGVMSPKGKINMSFGKPLNSYLEMHPKLKEMENDTFIDEVCSFIDKQIYRNFKLYPFNKIAYNRLHNNHLFEGEYSEEDCTKFDKYLESKIHYVNMNQEIFTKIFLEMYAAPVESKLLCDSI